MTDTDPSDNTGPSQAELDAAEANLEEAQERERACQSRLDQAKELFHQAQAKLDAFLANGRLSLSRIDDLVAQCAARANRAREALEKYLSANPTSSVAAFASLVRWTPTPGQIIDPGTLASRLKIPPDQLQCAVSYLKERIPSFREKLESYRTQLKSAQSDIERDALQTQCKRNLSGEFAERLVELAFRPVGTVSTQDRTVFENGSYTKTDLMVGNLRNPVVLGKGDRVYAPEGGSLAFEIKTGHASYLKSQKDHLVFQAGGHQEANASAIICTDDIHDLTEEEENDLRETLRSAGSPILGMLPRKDDIDQAILDAITGTEEDAE